jgi:dihydrofolate synthase / folylpolyglutamate synthase
MTCPAIDWLLGFPRFLGRSGPGYKPGLERMTALLEAMGDPHLVAPVAHVAGTNGKGSTASMIAAIGTASGRTVGLHTSPHLVSITERMRVDGEPAPDAWLNDAIERFRVAIEASSPSFFEVTTALSFLYFAEMGVDAAVIEVGLGGRFDATNVVKPAVCVITSIGLEHVDILGATHELIAKEKAGIIKPGIPIMSGVDHAGARDAIRTAAHENESPFVEPDVEVVAGYELGLFGAHQRKNASLAVEAARVLWPEIDGDSIARGLIDVVSLAGLRGRLEQVAPGLFVDVAHNADGISAALAAVRNEGKLVHVVVALMSDKDADRVASVIADGADSVEVLDLQGERLLPAVELMDALQSHGAIVEGILPVEEFSSTAQSRIEADATVLACGSHVVVAEVLRSFNREG